MERLRAIIIEDHPDVRRALSERLSNSDLILVASSTEGIAAGIELSEVEQPDVVLVGLRAQDQPRDIGQIKNLASQLHATRAALIVLTSYSFEDERRLLMQAGANRYLLKDIDTRHLIEEIQQSVSECRSVRPAGADQPLDPTTLTVK
jgi:DNA-binding NarL/FixJ family response regulator